MKQVEIMNAYCDYRSELKALGFDIRDVPNFDDALSLISGFEKVEITPRLSPLHNDFTSENSFWLILEYEGEAIGAVCARVDCLRGEQFHTYLQRTARRHYGSNGEVGVAEVLEEKRFNTVSYIGELFKKAEFRGNHHVSEMFLKCAFCLVFSKWDPDWIYAFLRNSEIKKSASSRYGFATQIPNAQTWTDPPKGRSSDEWLVAMTGSEFTHMVKCRQLYAASTPPSGRQ